MFSKGSYSDSLKPDLMEKSWIFSVPHWCFPVASSCIKTAFCFVWTLNVYLFNSNFCGFLKCVLHGNKITWISIQVGGTIFSHLLHTSNNIFCMKLCWTLVFATVQRNKIKLNSRLEKKGVKNAAHCSIHDAMAMSMLTSPSWCCILHTVFILVHARTLIIMLNFNYTMLILCESMHEDAFDTKLYCAFQKIHWKPASLL